MQLDFKKYFNLILLLGFGFSMMVFGGLGSFEGQAAGLLSNSGFNTPFNDIPDRIFRGDNEQIANSWNYFYIDANTYPGSGNASKLRWMSAKQFADTFGGIDYRAEGDQAQVMWSSYDFDGGVYQQVTGVTPGVAYGFDIGMVTYWRGSGYIPTNDKMIRTVGIDPYGGTDPTSANVIWSDPNGQDKAWVYMNVAATAQANTITVFAKVQAPENDSYNHTDLNIVYFDAAHFDLAPTANLNVSQSGQTINFNWSGSAASGWSLKGYEVQYKKRTDTNWIQVQDRNNQNTSSSFTGEAGQTYDIRVKAWQRTSESYKADIDMPGVWVEQSITLGEAIIGRVINHTGSGMSGISVSLVGTASATTSDSNGDYLIPTGSSGQFWVQASDTAAWVAPPATVVNTTLETPGYLTLTLRPKASVLTNNDLESDLAGWQFNGAAVIASEAAHTGQGGLKISGDASVSQTNTVSDMDSPLLSFWYRSNQSFSVEFLGIPGNSAQTQEVSAIKTLFLPATENWTHVVLESGLGEGYSGSVGVNFLYNGNIGNEQIYVDEVSIGVGAKGIYLPMILNNF